MGSLKPILKVGWTDPGGPIQVERFSGLYLTVGLPGAVMPVGLTGEPSSNPTLGDMGR